MKRLSELEQERQEFKESLSGYTDYNLVSLMNLHNVNKPGCQTARYVTASGKAYAEMIYEECLNELFERESPLLKEALA